MKRMAYLVLTLVLFILISVSCRTTGNEDAFTDEQYDYTLHLVLDQAQDKASSDLFKQLNEFKASMIPEQYSEIEQLRGEIPGMDLLIRQWTETSSLFVLQVYGDFTDYADTLKSKIVFRNPKALLEAGDDSISRYYSSLYLEDMVLVISRNIREMDFTALKKALVQYNAWASTNNKLYNENNELMNAEISSDELITLFSYHLAGLFFEHLAASEALIRTTPDLSMDALEAVVLGLV